MTIKQIVKNGKGRAGHGNHWCVEFDEASVTFNLYHYGTRMLSWRVDSKLKPHLIDCNTGHGSMSDQNGMNVAFKTLGFDLRYSRKGGASIVGDVL